MSSIKTKLVVGLSVSLTMTAATAGALYFGARSLEQNATRTHAANDEARDLLSFALAAHRYVGAFGQSLGQRTLIANNERRLAAKAFEDRMNEIPDDGGKPVGGALSWAALRGISYDLDQELNRADSLRAEGKFFEAEIVFNQARRAHFEQRMLPWFEVAINAQRSYVDAAEAVAVDEARTLRTAGALALLAAALVSTSLLVMIRAIIRPIRLLVEGAQAIADGDLIHRIPHRRADELGVLAERFNWMAHVLEANRATLLDKNRALEEAYKLQSEFLSLVSHELRSPLNSVIGYTELVIDEAHELSPVGKKNVTRIASCARRLLELINDILDFSKLRAGRMEVRQESFQAVDLAALVVEDGRALAHGRGVDVQLRANGEAIEMRSDVTKVRQILTNLVSNAVKFTDQGTVTLAVTRAGDDVRFSVADTGIGIAGHQLEIIFEPFRQAHGQDLRAVSGTGLGLAIVKHLSNLLGGQVSVDSVVGVGTEFQVILPAQLTG
jgi:signal transduction histidine kinase